MIWVTLEKTLREKQKKILCKQSIRITLNEDSHNLQVLVQSDKNMFSAWREDEEFVVLFQRETVNASLSNQSVYSYRLFATKLIVCEILIPLERFCEINAAYFTGKQLCWSLFLIKLQSLTWNFTKKGALTQVFSCDLFKIFKEHLFYKTPPDDCRNLNGFLDI